MDQLTFCDDADDASHTFSMQLVAPPTHGMSNPG